MNSVLEMKFYAVRHGRFGPAVYSSWDECHRAVNGYSGAEFKSFMSASEARTYLGQVHPPEPATVFAASDPRVRLYIDGSCLSQGTADAIAGIGIFSPELSVSIAEGVPGKQTNNRAELQAAIRALELIQELKLNGALIYTDSQYVFLGTKQRHTNNEDLWDKFFELRRACPSTDFVKVLGHSGDAGNETADRLSKEGAMARKKESF
ncbi:MAG: ribonuclease H family protein [Sulfobacillus sp.]